MGKNKGPGVKGRNVEVRNDNIEGALRKLDKIIKEEKVLKELKQRRYYEKPGDKKRRKHEQAVKRLNKKLQAEKKNNPW